MRVHLTNHWVSRRYRESYMIDGICRRNDLGIPLYSERFLLSLTQIKEVGKPAR
jgi:hypothetical protein